MEECALFQGWKEVQILQGNMGDGFSWDDERKWTGHETCFFCWQQVDFEILRFETIFYDLG